MNSDNGQQVIPQAEVKAWLNALTVTAGPLALCTLHLNKANLAVTPNTPLSALVEPTFTGYAAVASLTFGGAFNMPNGGGGMVAGSVTFLCTGGTPNETIYGWYLTDVSATLLRAYCPLGTGVPIAGPGDSVLVQPEIDMSGR